MYQVSIFNSGVETIIHHPDPTSSKVLSLSLKEVLSQPKSLNVTLPYGNAGYDLLIPLNTKVKVIDARDNTVRFTGRILPRNSSMSGTGEFTKSAVCEGALGYLNDTNTRRWNFTNQTPGQILQYLLDRHNEKVDNDRKIYLGTVEKNQAITIDTNYESTLNAIITKVRNIIGGDIRVRETSGTLYLDYLLDQGANNNVPVKLGYNMKELLEEYDPSDVVTRVIPLGYGDGVNQLNIIAVNGGLDYVEDSAAIAQYGVIEGVIPNLEIQNADTLKMYGQTVLSEKKQPRLTLNTRMLDLSVLPQYSLDKYDLGDTLNIINEVMNINVYARVIECETDLIQPQNRDIVISTKPIRLTDQMIDIRQRNLSLENAPQGSTCIFPLTKAENADADHPITFDLDIPKETININRVYLNIHGRKYRANSKDAAAGGSNTTTSGASSKTTSGGGGYQSGSVTNNNTVGAVWDNSTLKTKDVLPEDIWSDGSHYHDIDKSVMDHYHVFGVALPDHTHDINHTHSVTIGNHTHGAVYGIVESTYPKNVKVSVNSHDVGVSLGDGSNAFDNYDIDITTLVTKGNNKIQITTEQNGRIDAIVYSQIFIQAK